jgi:ATP-dependent Clp protease ATP-binding subunit ClpX
MRSILEMARRDSLPRLRCSFCGRSEPEVNRLVAGTSAYICDDCIAKCMSVLQDNGFAAPDPKRPN